MKYKPTIFGVVIGAVLLLTAGRWWPQAESGELDAFAQCLADKGITMYGADWCPHCQNEKRAFGDSFGFVPYVECPDNPKLCLEKGIEGYPTWIFPDPSTGSTSSPQASSGQAWRKLEGEQGIEKLAGESGC